MMHSLQWVTLSVNSHRRRGTEVKPRVRYPELPEVSAKKDICINIVC